MTSTPHLRITSALFKLQLGALSLGLLACGSPALQTWQSGLPGTSIEMQVDSVAERAGFLDIALSTRGLELRTFTAASEDCRAIAREGASVRWRSRGAWGEIDAASGAHAGAGTCAAQGIGRLAQWRDRRGDPARSRRGPVPRSQAVFESVYSDERGVVLRGRFELAARLGWTGVSDTLAVVGSSDACARAAAAGVASLEYRPVGDDVLVLLAGDSACRIEGLVIPPSG